LFVLTNAQSSTPAPVAWEGHYNIRAGICPTAQCCCLTGDIQLFQSGSTLGFTCSVIGQCGQNTSTAGNAVLPMLSTNSVLVLLNGDTYNATITGSYPSSVPIMTLQNLQQPECSVTASCQAGACHGLTLVSSGGHIDVKILFIGLLSLCLAF